MTKLSMNKDDFIKLLENNPREVVGKSFWYNKTWYTINLYNIGSYFITHHTKQFGDCEVKYTRAELLRIAKRPSFQPVEVEEDDNNNTSSSISFS